MSVTRAEAIAKAGEILAVGQIAADSMTPRELAEAAWTPTCKQSVEDLEARIRADRGMAPADSRAS